MFEYPSDVIHEQVEAKGEVCRMKHEWSMQAADSLKQSLSVSLQSSMNLAQEKGSSIWLTSPPPFRNLGLFYTNVLFKMPWLSIITGNYCKLPLLVLVVQSSPFNMLCHGLKVVSLPFYIMKSARDLTANLQKSAMTSAWTSTHWWWGLHWHFLIQSGWCKTGYCC